MFKIYQKYTMSSHTSVNAKIGFWSLIPIVVSSQIGGGAFIIPSVIAKYKEIGILSWVFTGIAAIFLSTMFSLLCSKYPLNGGPHIYISKHFGSFFGFLISWMYWLVSFFSTPTILFTITSTLQSIAPITKLQALSIEVSLLTAVTIANMFTLKSNSIKNAVLTLFKMIPIMSIFIFGWWFCDFNNLNISFSKETLESTGFSGFFSALNSAALISMWGFIGVESGTAPAESINSTRTIIKSSIIGTAVVFLIYIVNNTLIYGILSGQVLEKSPSAYVDTLSIIYGVKNSIFIPLMILPVCIASLNTWTIVSGQIALGASKLGLLPKFLGNVNRNESPYVAIIISSLAQLPILILGKNKDIYEKITSVIDISGFVFLFVYFISCIVFIKTFGKRYIVIGVVSTAFCVWTMLGAISYWYVILILMASGLPFYYLSRREHV